MDKKSQADKIVGIGVSLFIVIIFISVFFSSSSGDEINKIKELENKLISYQTEKDTLSKSLISLENEKDTLSKSLISLEVENKKLRNIIYNLNESLENQTQINQILLEDNINLEKNKIYFSNILIKNNFFYSITYSLILTIPLTLTISLIKLNFFNVTLQFKFRKKEFVKKWHLILIYFCLICLTLSIFFFFFDSILFSINWLFNLF